MRIRLDIAYDGTEFHGWAAQPGLRTVEGLLSAALVTVLRLTEARLTVAGRTDAGVHARGQVVHCDLPDETSIDGFDRLARRLNGILPRDLRIRGAAAAAPGFDARFGALSRRYAYRVADTAAAVDPLARRYVLAWPRPLNLDRMNQAATQLVGLQDFAAFCKKREGATTIRTLLDLRWEREDDGALLATVRADAFCHSMVRSLVGCLLAIGEGRRSPEWGVDLLSGRQRDPSATVAPAHGLTLEEVLYPPDHELPVRAVETRARRDGWTR